MAVACCIGLHEQILHFLLGFLRQHKTLLRGGHVENFCQFFTIVIREIDRVGDTAADAGVHTEHLLHLARIARHDDDQFVAVVLHLLDQGADGFITEVVFGSGIKGIGLIDEQDAAVRFLDFLQCLRSGLADVLSDQIFPRDFDHVSALQHTDGFQDLADQSRDGRLTCAGVAGEDHVQGQIVHRMPHLFAAFLGAHVVHDRADLFFDILQSDQITQLRHQVFDIIPEQLVRVDAEIERLKDDQIILRHGLFAQTESPFAHRFFHDVSDGTGIGELRDDFFLIDFYLEGLLRFLSQRIMVILGLRLGDFQQFLVGKIFEINLHIDPARQARIRFQQLLHAGVITRKDHDKVIAVIFHRFDQRIDGFRSVIERIAVRGRQRIGFIDEQHPAHGRFDDGFGLLGSLADVAADQVRAIHFHQLT